QVSNLAALLPPAGDYAEAPPVVAAAAASGHHYEAPPEEVGMSVWDYLRWAAFSDWNKQVAFGWTSQAGRQDVSDAQLRFGMSLEGERNQYRLQAEYRAAQTDLTTTADLLNVNF